MSLTNSQLPFPRETTMYGGGGNGQTINADWVAGTNHLVGKVYEVPDTVHGLGGTVKLRVIRNITGSAITPANKFVEMTAAAAGDFGRNSGGFGASVSAAGVVCKPMDDAYPTTTNLIKDDDLFYVVEEGPCNVLAESTITTAAAGTACQTDANGLADGVVAAATNFAVGTFDALPVADTNVRIHVNAGLQKPEA
jgi:hypothetical protein